jgi:N-acetylmuramoyl-L-alanine amidase
MRAGASIFITAWLLIFCAAASAHGASPVLEDTRIAGKDYVRLADWARSHQFTMKWVRPDEALELSNTGVRISLQIHSPEAQINGVEVRLLFPLVQKGEAVWISAADTRTTFDPVLAPPKLRRGPLRSICLDPGHGGKDPGFQVGSNQEKKIRPVTRAGIAVSAQTCGVESEPDPDPGFIYRLARASSDRPSAELRSIR